MNRPAFSLFAKPSPIEFRLLELLVVPKGVRTDPVL